jgi:O-antigen/teichoic acid export membrane protein
VRTIQELKRFIKNSGIYFVGNILSKVILFFMLPIYTAYIPPDQYGTYDMVGAYVTLISGVLFFDIWSAVLRYMFLQNEEGKSKYNAVYSGALIFISSGVLFSIVAYLVGKVAGFQYLPLVIAYGFLTCLLSYYSFVVRGFGKNIIFAVSGIIATITQVVSNLVLIIIARKDFSALYISNIISLIVQIVILECSVGLIRNFSVKFITKELCIKLLKFALPLSVNSLAYWILTGYNRIALTNDLGTYANGLYTVAGKFSIIITMVANCVQMAWQELTSAKTGTANELGMFFSKAVQLYIKMLVCGCLFLIPAIWIVYPILIDAQYSAARTLVSLYVVGTALSILSSFLGSIFGTLLNTRVLFWSSAIGAIVNLLMIHWLMDCFGVNGASLALIISFFLTSLVRVIIVKRTIPFKINMQFIVVGAISLCFCVLCSNTNKLWVNLLLLVFAFIVAIITFWKYIKSIAKFIFKVKKKGTK